jgi:hypothetical protein
LGGLQKLALIEHMSTFLSCNDLFISFARDAWSKSIDKPFYETVFALSLEDESRCNKSCSTIFADPFE